MFQVMMNGTTLVGGGTKWNSKKEVQEYVKTCKKIDKKYGEKTTYKIIAC